MSDQPVFVPGRPNRKLRAMVAELEELRRGGLTAADIHRWLATRGIVVDYTTVRKEIKKLEQRAAAGNAPPSPSTTAPGSPAVVANAGAQANTQGDAKPKHGQEKKQRR